MIRSFTLLLLLTLSYFRAVATDNEPIVSGSQSATCPLNGGYSQYSSSPQRTYNSADVSFYGCFNAGATSTVRYRPIGTGIWQYAPVTGDSWASYASFRNLTPSTGYEWQLACVCASGDTSAYTVPKLFTTLPCTNGASYLTTSNVSIDKATLNWYGQASFVFQWRSVGSSSWNIINPVPSRPVSLTGLTDQTAYEWRVAEVCTPTQLSDYSPVQSFTTTCPVPTELTTTNIGYANARLNWQGLRDLTFEVQTQPQGVSSWSTIATQTGTSYVLSTPNGAYNWRVRTVCEPGRFSGYLEPQSFTMGPCPETQLAKELSQLGTNGYSATIRVYAGGRYSIQWREANASQWQVIDDNSAYDFVLTGLRTNTAYEIRAQTQCSATDRSAFSEPISFTATCQIPYINGSGSTYGSVQVYSLSQANVLIQWRDEGTQTWNTSPLLNEFNGSSAVRYWFGGKSNRAYEIRAQAVCADGSSSDFTPPHSFRPYSELSAPIHSLSTGCVGWGSARISWGSNVVLQDAHTLQWRPKNTICWNTITLADSVSNPTYGSYPVPHGEYIVRDLLPKTEYEYRLGTVLTDNAEPTFTDIQNFTTAAGDVYIYSNTVCPTLGADQVRLSWQTSECFGSPGMFECQYRPIGSADWQTAWLSAQTPYSLTGLTPNTTYEYRVRLTISDQYVGAFSSMATFRTGYGQIEGIYTLSQNGRECTERTMVWNGCGLRGASFEVAYGQVGEAGGAILGLTTTDNTITLLGLIPKKTYQIQVRAVYSDGTTTPFYSQTFTAGCWPVPNDLPRDLCQYSITELSARLQWKGYGPFELRWRKAYTTAWNTVILPSTYSSFPVVYTLTGLDPNMTYEWQVRSVRMEPVTFSSMQFFRTVCNAPVYARAKITSATSATLVWTQANPSQSFTLQWRKKGETSWQRVETIARPDYVLDSLQRNTVYEWRISTKCTGARGPAEGPVQTFRTVSYIDWIYTVQPGLWTEPTTWSCNRVPTAADGVQILHHINIPTDQTGNAAILRYGTGGNLTFDEKARLLLSF